jgi:hypothetical protein
MERRSVTIDDFTFTVTGRCEYEGRPVFEYTNGVNTYYAYKSQSEGLWRFAATHTKGYIRGMESGTLFKGEHYITSSQLHMDLQRLLSNLYNDNIAVPAVDCGGIMLTEESGKIPEFENLLYGSQRQYTGRVFSPLEALCNNDDEFCLGRFDSVERIVNQKIKGSCVRMLNCIAPGYLTNKYYTRFRHFLSRSPIVDKASIINVMSAYMIDHFTYDLSPSVCILETSIETIVPTPIQMFVYVTTLTLKEDTTQTFRLYYATYVREGVPYKIILNIIPANTSVNSYGLYNTYISAGIYAFKPFNQTGADYSFIGHIMNNMWPLLLLTEGPAIPIAVRPVAAIPAASSVPVVGSSEKVSLLRRRATSASKTGGRRCRRKSRRLSRKRR